MEIAPPFGKAQRPKACKARLEIARKVCKAEIGGLVGMIIARKVCKAEVGGLVSLKGLTVKQVG